MSRSQDFLKFLDDTPSREDVASHIKTLTDFVKQAKKNLDDAAKKKAQELDEKLSQISTAIEQHKTDSTTRQDQDRETMYSESRTLLRMIEQAKQDILALIPESYDDTDLREEIAELRSQIPSLPDELSAEAIRDKLELLDGEERLDASAIKGLDEYIAEKASKPTQTYMVGGGTGGGKVVKVYDLSSSLDGSTKTFSLPAFWRVLTVDLSSFPHTLRPTTDYTTDASAMTITFTSEIDETAALATGQTCIITYVE